MSGSVSKDMINFIVGLGIGVGLGLLKILEEGEDAQEADYSYEQISEEELIERVMASGSAITSGIVFLSEIKEP